MDHVQDYARKRLKRGQEKIDSLSELKETVKSLILKRTRVLSRSLSFKAKSVFTDHNVGKKNIYLHDKCDVVVANTVNNNMCLSATHYIQ